MLDLNQAEKGIYPWYLTCTSEQENNLPDSELDLTEGFKDVFNHLY